MRGDLPQPATPGDRSADDTEPARHAAEPAACGSPALPIIPDHQLLRRIGAGSYGEVWLARNVVATYRAVKVVYRKTFEHERPYEREFAGIQKFEPISRSHEGLVDILQIGRNDAAGYFYYVMELADDASLQSGARLGGMAAAGRTTIQDSPIDRSGPGAEPGVSLIDSNTYIPKTLRLELSRRGRLSLEDCLHLGLSLSSALEHMHGQGLIHRDIKPSNIILVNGVAKLADIGLVAGLGEARSYVGTEGFIPPEGPGTPQADLYSLGKVLYELSTGKDRQDFPQLPADFQSSPTRRQLGELNDIILRACAADVAARYASAAAMRRDLELLKGGDSIKRRRAREHHATLLRRWTPRVAIAAALLAGALVWRPQLFRLAPPENPAAGSRLAPEAGAAAQSIAVLPLANESSDPGDLYLGEELAEELANALIKSGEFRVAARNTAIGIHQAADRLAAAQRLGIQALLEGSVRKSGAKVRLNIQLVRGRDGSTLWSEIYTASLSEMFGLVIHLAERASEKLAIPLTESQRQRMASRPTANFEAYQLYLQGRWHWNQRTKEGITQALRMFEAAIAQDTNFALAYAGLADSYMLLVDHGYMPASEGRSRAAQAIEKALAIDERLAEAHAASAMLKEMNWEWPEAERAYQRAIAFNPNYAPARKGYADFLGHQRRYREALDQAQQAVHADPFSAMAFVSYGAALSGSGQLEAALEQFGLASQIDPNYQLVSYFIGWSFVENRQYERAIPYLEESVRRIPDSTMAIAVLGYGLGLAGRRTEAQVQLQRLEEIAGQRRVSPYFFALVHLGLDQRAQALAKLEQAYAEHDDQLIYLKLEPYYSDLRLEPRFRELLKKTGLEP